MIVESAGILKACKRYSKEGGGGGRSSQISQAEIDGLNYMREEEKLARDVYLTLYDVWHLFIFSNISGSETMHMVRIKELLDIYNLPDPAAGNSIGEFTNPDLQHLFDDLVAKGQLSKIDALQVGVAVEEVDISDLQRFMALTEHTDIQNVYGSLLSASNNHLRAFSNQLGQ